ncbi:aldehyde dehydrogenase (NAD(P)(+)) ald5 [Steccherinum ochraceum]|uniref:Aldehyde dehydrogenase (NAD(P)(+)) ald5 n=1 Tax=Steccherinum ochraceum TaxID=92696 RepID=A0A4R0RF06_9APHY|nr:aldehyde dehydrogenase (NAD(P)(+)) ald5 [Steccherinum ochraceum]
MSGTFTHDFKTPAFKGKVSIPTGLFIGGKFVDGKKGETWDVINPTNGKKITSVASGTVEDVDYAVKVAQKAFDETWGLKCPGNQRSKYLNKIADLMEEHLDEFCALEALNTGKPFSWAKKGDMDMALDTFRYYAGWADKISGKVIETSEDKLSYTRHEPIGVVAQIIAWNFPIMLLAWKVAPALACGNVIILKPSEFTPLTALLFAKLANDAGVPPGVINIINGTGPKIAFTGSTLTGRKIMQSAGKSNLKNVTLELGGKSPNIIMDDADIDQAVDWTAHGVYWNMGQACCAGTRIFVHEKVYDQFLKKFTEKTKKVRMGDPFGDVDIGALVSNQQFERVLDYIDSGKKEGATVHLGGEALKKDGFWVEPTIFTDVTPDMKIVQEEIFGPVGVIIKFKDDEDAIRQANDTTYGLAAAVFSKNVDRALQTAHRLNAGTAWVNCVNQLHAQVPFGGFKQSGIGRELGEYALENYTAIKAVHVNFGHKI